MEDNVRDFVQIDAIRPSTFELNKPRQFRFIDYVGMVRVVWYPTLGQDKDGRPTTSWKKINKPKADVRTDLDKMLEVEKRAALRLFPDVDPKTLELQFSPAKSYWFLCFDRAEAQPVVKVFEAGWNIFDTVKENMKVLSPTKPGYLANGLFWFHDILITATKKEARDGTPEKFRRQYTVNIYSNKFENLVPAAALDESTPFGQKAQDLDWLREKGVYTAEEVEAIIDFKTKNDYMRWVAPATPEDIHEELFVKNPILLTAMKKGGVPVFPYFAFLVEEFKKAALAFDDTSVLEKQISERVSSPVETKKEEEPSEAPPLSGAVTTSSALTGNVQDLKKGDLDWDTPPKNAQDAGLF